MEALYERVVARAAGAGHVKLHMGRRLPPTREGMDCLRAATSTFDATCFSYSQVCICRAALCFWFFPNPRPLHHHHPLLVTLFTAQYDYGMKLAMSVVSMCETGVSAESIVTAIHAVCPTKMF